MAVCEHDRRPPFATDGGHEPADAVKVRSAGLDFVGDPGGCLGERFVNRDDLAPAQRRDRLVDVAVGVGSDTDEGLGVRRSRDDPGLLIAAIGRVVRSCRRDAAEAVDETVRVKDYTSQRPRLRSFRSSFASERCLRIHSLSASDRSPNPSSKSLSVVSPSS
jgi:hypothetical protein